MSKSLTSLIAGLFCYLRPIIKWRDSGVSHAKLDRINCFGFSSKDMMIRR